MPDFRYNFVHYSPNPAGLGRTQEKDLGRVINPNGVGKERNRLVKAVAIALREMMQQSAQDETTRDLAAFIVLALESIAATIDQSVLAWEKRGYWVKADRFRMDWAWTGKLGNDLQEAVLDDDWGTVAITMAKISEKLGGVKIPARHRLGTPWRGAWEKLAARNHLN